MKTTKARRAQMRKYNKRYYKANRKRLLDKMAKRRQAQEEVALWKKCYARGWYLANRAKAKARSRRYYHTHKAQYAAYRRGQTA